MRNPKEPIRLGIIGCGRVAEERHLPPLLHLREFRVVSTADLDEARSRRFADQVGAEEAVTDYRAVLERPDVEAIAILTPTLSHAEIGLAALDAGKHILIEKPLAMNVEECERLIARAGTSPCKVVVGFNLRWHRLVRRAREFLATGRLGRIKAIRSAYTHNRTGETAPDWHCKLDLGGGVAFNEGVHHFDLWRYLTGRQVEQVYSVSVPSVQYEDETNVVTARLSGNILGTGVFTFKTGPTSDVEVYGENGRLCLSLYRFDGLEYFPSESYPGNLRDRLVKTIQSLGDLPGAIRGLRTGGEFQTTFNGLWAHFADCILHDRPSQCSLQDGRESLKVALAVVESARSGAPVRLGRIVA